jgi:hypothetical protein
MLSKGLIFQHVIDGASQEIRLIIITASSIFAAACYLPVASTTYLPRISSPSKQPFIDIAANYSFHLIIDGILIHSFHRNEILPCRFAFNR